MAECLRTDEGYLEITGITANESTRYVAPRIQLKTLTLAYKVAKGHTTTYLHPPPLQKKSLLLQ